MQVPTILGFWDVQVLDGTEICVSHITPLSDFACRIRVEALHGGIPSATAPIFLGKTYADQTTWALVNSFLMRILLRGMGHDPDFIVKLGRLVVLGDSSSSPHSAFGYDAPATAAEIEFPEISLAGDHDQSGSPGALSSLTITTNGPGIFATFPSLPRVSSGTASLRASRPSIHGPQNSSARGSSIERLDEGPLAAMHDLNAHAGSAQEAPVLDTFDMAHDVKLSGLQSLLTILLLAGLSLCLFQLSRAQTPPRDSVSTWNIWPIG